MEKSSWKKFCKKYQLLPLTKQILLAIAKGVILPIELTDAMHSYRGALMRGGLPYVRILKREREERRLRYALYTLKRNNYIAMRKTGDQFMMKLTEAGVTEILALQCRVAPTCVFGTFVVVLFDIPERERHVRRQLRLFLRECGFRLLQRSVWVSDREVFQRVKEFVRITGADKWVTVLRCVEQ
ncbi:CRISPR-associated endonuclease Cas2 [Candidatus Uhrbacteria bacterium]|nr:CRISPR-associated endonuclease Cas2 [Candidatus Uhrbacteria bacterium]